MSTNVPFFSKIYEESVVPVSELTEAEIAETIIATAEMLASEFWEEPTFRKIFRRVKNEQHFTEEEKSKLELYCVGSPRKVSRLESDTFTSAVRILRKFAQDGEPIIKKFEAHEALRKAAASTAKALKIRAQDEEKN